MSKEFPTPEKLQISDDQLVAALGRGIEHVDVRLVLERWTEQEEKNVPNDPVALIEFNRRRARLYRRAGYSQEAIGVLEDAGTQARNERRDELYEDILAEIDQIEEDNR